LHISHNHHSSSKIPSWLWEELVNGGVSSGLPSNISWNDDALTLKQFVIRVRLWHTPSQQLLAENSNKYRPDLEYSSHEASSDNIMVAITERHSDIMQHTCWWLTKIDINFYAWSLCQNYQIWLFSQTNSHSGHTTGK